MVLLLEVSSLSGTHVLIEISNLTCLNEVMYTSTVIVSLIFFSQPGHVSLNMCLMRNHLIEVPREAYYEQYFMCDSYNYTQ